MTVMITPYTGEKKSESDLSLGSRTGRVNPHGLWVGYSWVQVGVDFLLPIHNPYPVRGYRGYRTLGTSQIAPHEVSGTWNLGLQFCFERCYCCHVCSLHKSCTTFYYVNSKPFLVTEVKN